MSPLVSRFRSLSATVFSHPAEITLVTVKPAACATGVVESAPRITDQVVLPPPVMLVTVMTSDPAAGSAMWNWETLVAAVGNPAELATTHVSGWPLTSVPEAPAGTVVTGESAKTSVTVTAHLP